MDQVGGALAVPARDRRATTAIVLGVFGFVLALGLSLITLLIGAEQVEPYGVDNSIVVTRNTFAALGGPLGPVLALLGLTGLVLSLRATGPRGPIVLGRVLSSITLLAVAGIIVATVMFRGGIAL